MSSGHEACALRGRDRDDEMHADVSTHSSGYWVRDSTIHPEQFHRMSSASTAQRESRLIVNRDYCQCLCQVGIRNLAGWWTTQCGIYVAVFYIPRVVFMCIGRYPTWILAFSLEQRNYVTRWWRPQLNDINVVNTNINHFHWHIQ